MHIPLQLVSGSTTQGNFLTRLPSVINLSGHAICKLRSLVIPMTVANISSAKANNSLVYTYGGTDFTITIPDGLYTATQLRDAIYASQYSNNHYSTDLSNNVTSYSFSFDVNQATAKAWIKINTVNSTTISAITFTGSTLWKVMGYASSTAISDTNYHIAENMMALSQNTSHFRLEVDIVNASYGSNGSSTTLYSNILTSPHAYNRYPISGEGEVIGYINRTSVAEIRCRIIDDTGAEMIFLSNSTNLEEIVMCNLDIIDE